MRLAITNASGTIVFETVSPTTIEAFLGGLRLERLRRVYNSEDPHEDALIAQVETEHNKMLAQLGL